MLGSLFLHWNGECSMYQRLYSHLQTKLDANIATEIGLNEIIVRSDEEKPILKAAQQSFPPATQILCQHHLQDLSPPATYRWSPRETVKQHCVSDSWQQWLDKCQRFSGV